ncbi:AfsR/SARP family transcriptional regulator [Motilibacter aurantiacus]|uniref:AfsR/SARP family transcriptional regulator n=1 Tax=Motilibacter aurantiacus TaxID=2714955 RepID=UPI00140B56EF|nr:AfsR/SARP family transcriptional regulator [Motilibacter aurantiacus]NHC43682.1 AAA family ATPase [Motilibacter aurantiacus]
MVTFRVLGPLEAYAGDRPLGLKGPRHRAVLARLLVSRGRVVPVRRLVEDLWEDAPEGAVGAVQTFVGALRKALEPDRPPRTPSRLLITAAPGYALRPGRGAVDAWRFEDAVADAERLLASGGAAGALARLERALEDWRGGAYAEFAELPWAHAEAARLEELRLLAVERHAAAALALGRDAAAVPGLEAHVEARPLREEGWRLLALALYRSGRQADALAVLRRAREALRGAVGADPGPALGQLQADILAHAPALLPAPAAVAVAAPVLRSEAPFVGRTDELAALEQAAAAVLADGRPRVALVSGAPGAGKTALARELAGRLAAAGWATGRGECPELTGAPTVWPWTGALRSAGAGEQELRSAGLGGPGPAEGQRFDRARSVVGLVAAAAARRPLLLVLDDLHWADEDTLALLAPVATSDAGRALLVVTYRSTELSGQLTEALARLARGGPLRVYLGGLPADQVGALAEAVASRPLPPAQVRRVHARSGGNPFFVHELLRVWDAEGEAALQAVPPGVRDVLRHRLGTLPAAARDVLRRAAVLGGEVELELLVAADGDEGRVLDAVEAALLAGFVEEAGPDRMRFAHALVQETVYADVPFARRAQWHAAAAAYLLDVRPDDIEALAFHLVRAGSRVDAAVTARYAAAAARRAERRSAMHDAARLWDEALAALDRLGTDAGRAGLQARMGLVRALAVTGRLGEARSHRARALDALDPATSPLEAVDVLGSFDVPAIWPVNDDEQLSARLVEASERALVALPPGRDAERARLLVTVAMERRADTGPRGGSAADEAERLARRLDDPGLLVLALNARFLQSYARAGLARERARVGAELVAATRGEEARAPFAVLGHLVQLQSACALADLAGADGHAAAVDELAERFALPAAGTFTAWYAALRLAIGGRRTEAGAAYRSAAGRLAGAGMSGLEDGILGLALATLDDFSVHSGPYAPWVRPLALLARGNVDAAQEALRAVPPSPHDALLEARSCLHASAAAELGDREAAERLYALLLPAEDELAGAGSGLVTLGPVALHLGRLAGALGRREQAGEHFRRAARVAERARAGHWRDRALAAVSERPGPRGRRTST